MKSSRKRIRNSRKPTLWSETRLRASDYVAVTFIVLLLAPQTTIFGRAELTVGCFVLWAVVTMGRQHVKSISACLTLLLALLLQVGVYSTKGWVGESYQLLSQASAGLVTLGLSLYFTTYYTVNAPDRFHKIRVFGIIGLAACVSYSLLIVWQEPGIGRRMIWDGFSDESMALRLKGVPGYPQIYMLVMCAPIFVDGLRKITGHVGVLYIAALAILFGHILLSTLTLAGVLFGVSILLYTISRFRHDPKKMAVILYVCVFALIGFGSALQMDLSLIPQVESVVNKAEGLLAGIFNEGLVVGDDTGRGERLQSSFDAFLDYPFFGVPFNEGNMDRVGGHSSLVDPFGMFGILGYIPMWFFLFMLTRNGIIRRSGLSFEWNVVGLIAWGVFWVASFWNTTTLAVLPYALFFLPVAGSRNLISKRRIVRT